MFFDIGSVSTALAHRLPAPRPMAAACLATALTGLAIKALDDFLDHVVDAAQGVPNLRRREEAVVAYAVLAAALGVAASAAWALALLTAAWAIGMAPAPDQRTSWGLRGWQEGLLVAAVGIAASGWLWLPALALVVGVQWADNEWDGSLFMEVSRWRWRAAGLTGWAVAAACAPAPAAVALAMAGAATLWTRAGRNLPPAAP